MRIGKKRSRILAFAILIASIISLSFMQAQTQTPSPEPGYYNFVLTSDNCSNTTTGYRIKIASALQSLHHCDYVAKFPGLYPSDRFGWAMAFGAHKVNSNTKKGIIIGAPFAEGFRNVSTSPSSLSGSAFLFTYSSGAWHAEPLWPAYNPNDYVTPFPYRPYLFQHRIDVSDQEIGARMGWAMAWINSRAAFSTDEFALGAPFADTPVFNTSGAPRPKYINGGLVYIISGENGQIAYRLRPPAKTDGSYEPESWFGLSMVYAEHFYGPPNDPVLIVGAPGPGMAGLHNPATYRNTGYVAIYSMATSTPVWVETIAPTGANAQGGQQFGYSVAVASKDQTVYLAVGAPYYDVTSNDNSGRVYLYEPPSTVPIVYNGPSTGSQLGHSIAFLYDSNHNPYALAMGAPEYQAANSVLGAVKVAPLPGGSPHLLAGERKGSQFGWSLANAGDQDNDGVDDLLVGAPLFDPPSSTGIITPHSEVGRVYLYYSPNFYGGSPGVLDGEDLLDRFGWSLGAYDADGDGTKEIFIGAAWADQYVRLACGGYRGFSGSVYMYTKDKFSSP